jgi:hypothetical protein
MIHQVAALVLLGYAPGAALYRIPTANRPRRERLDAAERLFWAVMLSVTWTLIVALALAALHRYSLNHVLAIDAALTLAIAGYWRTRLRFANARPPSATAIAPVALLVLVGWLHPPAAEYIVGGKDPGVYVNAGIQIAQRGGLIAVDETARSVPAESRSLFFPQYVGQPYYSPRFMGFFLLDPSTGMVVDQFPHLYPTAIAIGYSVGGLTGARDVALILAALGVLALYFLGARLAGPSAAAAAAALLAINVIEVWYARYPNSEMLTQALGLTGLLAVARANVDDDGFFAPVAGIILGLLPFARFDAVVISGLVVAAVVLQWLAGDRLRFAFLFPLAVGTALFVVYLLGWLAPYAVLPRIFVMHHRLALGAALGAALVIIAIAAWFRRNAAIRRLLIAWVPRVLLTVAVVLVAYAWFLRQPGGSLPAHDAYSLRAFGWYVAPAALGAAVIGLALLMTRRFWTDPAFFVVFIGIGIFVFDHLRIVPEHFWAARRFVPIILPGTMLAIGAALAPSGPAGASTAERLAYAGRQGLRLVLLALVAWSFWSATRPILPHVEYAGIIPKLEQIASRFGPDDLLIVESRNASDLHVLALPLAYTYGKQVLLLATPRPDSLRFAQFLQWARRTYRNVYFLGGGGTDLLSREVAVDVVAGERFQVPEYESLRNAYPTHVRRKEFDFGIYRFVDPVPNAEGLSLDIGAMDDLYVVRFHAKERDKHGSFRWTRAQSYLSLVGVNADARELVLWMESGGRPPQAVPAEVEVFFGTTSLGKVAVARQEKAYVFEIPPALAAEAAASVDSVTVRLISTTWNPRALTGADDNRDLGVMVDRVEVRRVGAAR